MATGPTKTTEAVIQHHAQALGSRKLDEIVKDYTPDSVIFAPMGKSKGLKSIREAFTGFLGMLTPEAMANWKIIKQDIDGEYVYVIWSALPVIPFASDTLRIHNGKIVMQSVVFQTGR
jgi:ketosteroid isomerase-like protein